MTVFELQALLVGQGADRHALGRVNEALTNADLLPTWGYPETGSPLTPRHVATFIMGMTSPKPEGAAGHCTRVSSMIRYDGLSLGEVLTGYFGGDSQDNFIHELNIGANHATIRRQRTLSDAFSINGGLAAVAPVVQIRGSLLAQIRLKMQHPTVSGWKGEEQAEE